MIAYSLRPNAIEIPLLNAVVIPGYTQVEHQAPGIYHFSIDLVNVYINGAESKPYSITQAGSSLIVLLSQSIYPKDHVRLNLLGILADALTAWLDVQIVPGGSAKRTHQPSPLHGQVTSTATWEGGYQFSPTGVKVGYSSDDQYIRVFPDNRDSAISSNSCIWKTLIDSSIPCEVDEVFTVTVEMLSPTTTCGQIMLLSGAQTAVLHLKGVGQWQEGSVSLAIAERGELEVRLGVASGDSDVKFRNLVAESNFRKVFYRDALIASTTLQTWLSSGSTRPNGDGSTSVIASWRDSFDDGELNTSLVNLSEGKLVIAPDESYFTSPTSEEFNLSAKTHVIL